MTVGVKILLAICLPLFFVGCNDSKDIKNVDGRRLEINYIKTKGVTEFYFESTSPNASRATPLYEYIKISLLNDIVWGAGTGDFMAGSEPWTLSFKGLFVDKNNMKLNVTYLQEG